MSAASSLGISSIRLELIYALRKRSPSTVSELAEELGRTRNGVGNHLQALQELGIVRSEVARVAWSCRPATQYHLDAERVEAVAWDIFDALTIAIP
jgi:predicted ArsR family transcriptional regulator